jgi:hypothetical protein
VYGQKFFKQAAPASDPTQSFVSWSGKWNNRADQLL